MTAPNFLSYGSDPQQRASQSGPFPNYGGTNQPRRAAMRRPRDPNDPNAPQRQMQAPQAQPTAGSPTGGQTFAQMQASGVARPSPEMVQQAQAPQGFGMVPSLENNGRQVSAGEYAGQQADQKIGANLGSGVYNGATGQSLHYGDAGFANALQQYDPSRYEAYAAAGVPGFTVGGAAGSPGNRQGVANAAASPAYSISAPPPGPATDAGRGWQPNLGGLVPDQTPGGGTAGGTPSGPTPGAPPTGSPPQGTPGDFTGGAVGASLQDAILKALNGQSRYDLDQVKQVRDALTGDITNQFGLQRQSLDEDLARRGLGNSTIAANKLSQLGGAEDRAKANLTAQLIQDQAATAASDRASALGAGQNYFNTLQSGDQFSRQLAQQLGIATMQDKTANRGVDAQAALANSDLMLKVAQFLASQGYGASVPSGGGGVGGVPTNSVPSNPYTPTNTGGKGGGAKAVAPGGLSYSLGSGQNLALPGSSLSGGITQALGGQPSAQAPAGYDNWLQQAIATRTGMNPTGATMQTPGGHVMDAPNAQGQVASGRPIEMDLLSMTPQQSQDTYGFALSRNRADYAPVGVGDAQGVLRDSAGNIIGNTVPGLTVYRDTTTGHMMPADLLQQQPWWGGR